MLIGLIIIHFYTTQFLMITVTSLKSEKQRHRASLYVIIIYVSAKTRRGQLLPYQADINRPKFICAWAGRRVNAFITEYRDDAQQICTLPKKSKNLFCDVKTWELSPHHPESGGRPRVILKQRLCLWRTTHTVTHDLYSIRLRHSCMTSELLFYTK